MASIEQKKIILDDLQKMSNINTIKKGYIDLTNKEHDNSRK